MREGEGGREALKGGGSSSTIKHWVHKMDRLVFKIVLRIGREISRYSCALCL